MSIVKDPGMIDIWISANQATPLVTWVDKPSWVRVIITPSSIPDVPENGYDIAVTVNDVTTEVEDINLDVSTNMDDMETEEVMHDRDISVDMDQFVVNNVEELMVE